ncbi:hypothetical protein ACQ4PT_032198 [Festuca glaucescens]
MDLSQAPPTAEGVSPLSTVVDVPVAVMGGQPSTGDVAAMIFATMPGKRKRAAKPLFQAPAAAAAAPAVTPAAASKGSRTKTKSAGPRGAPPSKAKKPASRVGLATPPSKAATPPPSVLSHPIPPFTDADRVFDGASTTSYMDMLNGSTVNLDADIDPFDEEHTWQPVAAVGPQRKPATSKLIKTSHPSPPTHRHGAHIPRLPPQMAKPLPAEEETAALRRRLRKLVATITAGCAGADAFDEAAAALASLREAEVGGSGKGARGEETRPAEDAEAEAEAVPAQFLCPISSKIMADPVVVESGQTYDRHFIVKWFSAGNQMCPQTKQVILNTTLIPNLLIRSMIAQWCTENGFALPPLENQEEDYVSNSERRTFDEIFNKITSSSNSTEQKQAIKGLRLLTKRSSEFRALLEERPESISQMTFARFSTPGLQNDPQVVEDMVTIILNFSLHDSNKKIIGDDPEAIPFLIWALKSGDMGSRSNSAAAIFTLSALDSNKEKIGELGAIEPLIDLLDHGSIIAKKDAASAIFNLCMLHENRSIATSSGIVDVALRAIGDQSLVEESLAILALLSSNYDMVELMIEFGGATCMLQAIRESECKRSKENAAVILFSICMYNRKKVKEVEEDESTHGSLASLAQNGTPRARRKATATLEMMKRTKPMHNRHSSC